MTGEGRIIEVRLPREAQPSEEDVDRLRAVFQAIASLRCERGHDWEAIRRRLEGDGWKVQCRLEWHVKARRGTDCEEATGGTLDEAFTDLRELTLLDRAQA